METGHPFTPIPLSLVQIPRLYYFFKKSLSIEDHYYFMPHPSPRIIAYSIYYAMLLQQKCKLAHYLPVYFQNDKQIGAFLLLRNIQSEEAELGIAISKDYQGKGYARILLGWLESYAKVLHINQLYLSFAAKNEKAEQLYLKCGYEKVDLFSKKTLSGKPRIECRMTKDLT